MKLQSLLHSMKLQRIGYDSVTEQQQYISQLRLFFKSRSCFSSLMKLYQTIVGHIQDKTHSYKRLQKVLVSAALQSSPLRDTCLTSEWHCLDTESLLQLPSALRVLWPSSRRVVALHECLWKISCCEGHPFSHSPVLKVPNKHTVQHYPGTGFSLISSEILRHHSTLPYLIHYSELLQDQD